MQHLNHQLPGITLPVYEQRGQQFQAQQLQAQYTALVQQLAMQIYSSAVARNIRFDEFTIDEQIFRQLAKNAHDAAKAFYEGIGIAPFNKQTSDNNGGEESPRK